MKELNIINEVLQWIAILILFLLTREQHISLRNIFKMWFEMNNFSDESDE